MMKTTKRNIIKNDVKLSLKQILVELSSILPCEDYIWSILDFDGIGKTPNDETMPEFEKTVRNSITGYRLGWEKLSSFASTLIDTHDCLVVGAKSENDFVMNELNNDDFSRCEVVVDYHDSYLLTIMTKE
ncbi:hypothetical protein [Kiloniella sp.]|uniref:hypothetical protein n=1 Tax=Kiloniella sp. TaxID=1938587 RepID=UPI003A926A39